MAQWSKGKLRQREPPPALFLHASPAASNVSLALAGGAGAAGGGASGSSGAAGPGSAVGMAAAGSNAMSTSSGAGNMKSGTPSMAALQRTTSLLRQGVSGSGGGGGGTATGGSNETRDNVSGGGGGGGGGGGSSSGGPTMAAAFSLPLSMPLRHESTRATDRTDALWAEMQATLEEVELSASEGTRVFGADHDQKLAELRHAQIALAHAWARSEADDSMETAFPGGGGSAAGAGADAADTMAGLSKTTTGAAAATGASSGVGVGGGVGAGAGAGAGVGANSVSGAGAGRDDAPTAAGGAGGGVGGHSGAGSGGGGDSTAGTASGRAGSSRGIGLGERVEEETQVDILLARKRREANDRYFQRVSQGVLDVVAKLDDVASAMRAVEQESKDVWSDNDSDQNGKA